MKGMPMRYGKVCLAGMMLVLSWAAVGSAEDYTLRYFLSKVSAKGSELSREERNELLNRMDALLQKAQEVRRSLAQAIQGGEITMDYQEGRFWVAKLDEDRTSITIGMEQLKLLKEKPEDLVRSIMLYKSLRDLSINFNAYNNAPLLCSYVGDLAPEIALWADPVLYHLHLLPLAASRDKEMEKEVPKVEKKPSTKEKKR